VDNYSRIEQRASCVIEYITSSVHYTMYACTLREIPLNPRPRDCLFLPSTKTRGMSRLKGATILPNECILQCAGIILCKSHYFRFTALQPTVMYSGGGFMWLCRIILDLTHYYRELSATIRDLAKRMIVQSVLSFEPCVI